MRDLFLILLSEADLSNPRELFEKYNASMSEDYAHQLLPPDDTNAELLRWMLLIEIEERLQGMGKEVLFTEIGEVTEEMRIRVREARQQHNLVYECREIREEISYDREEMEASFQKAQEGEGIEQRGKMRESQRKVFESVRLAWKVMLKIGDA